VVYQEEEDVVSSQPVVSYEGMEFDTLDEAWKVYNDYAFKMSFSIRVGYAHQEPAAWVRSW
jgi:hypothetical protein